MSEIFRLGCCTASARDLNIRVQSDKTICVTKSNSQINDATVLLKLIEELSSRIEPGPAFQYLVAGTLKKQNTSLSP
jgi:hypothetical protein